MSESTPSGVPEGRPTGSVRMQGSQVEGLGVFAARGFAPNDVIRVINVVREITDDAPLRPEDGERFEHCAYPDDRVVLLGEPDCYLNHSCDPNSYVVYVGEESRIVARREIAEGEEVTVDYLVNNSGGHSWPCSCGATRCRGSTGTSYFDLPEEFREEYRPLLADWFVARHRDRL